MKPKWKRDSDGDYTLSLPTGQSAWIAKSDGGKNHKSWNGRVIGSTGTTLRVSGWSLASAKSAAETLLGIE